MAVTVNLSMLADMRKAISARVNKEKVADLVIENMKESIAAGLSPVRGIGRFVAYKNPAKYPGDQKSRRPVNLYLSGDMLAALKFYPTSGPGVSVGIKGAEGKKAAANNNGTKDVPRRHFMPTDRGEEFSVTITRKIRDLYSRMFSDILKR